jgi:hypothetical protein
MATGIQVEGLRETIRDLQAAGVELEDLKDVMGDIAAKAADVMKPYVPSRSGKLRGTVRGNRAKGKAVVTIGRGRVKYAGPINYGWPARNIRPANYTGKTDAAMDDLAARMLEDGINKIITEKGLGE